MIMMPSPPFGGEVKGGISPKGRVVVFKGKEVIVIGERDGVAGPAIASCVTASGGKVALVHTDCFV